MKRKLIALMIMAGAFAFTPFSADAQGLGGLLKKGKQALEKVTKSKETPAETATTQTVQSNARATNSITLDNGIEMTNPLAEYIEITPVGLYATSTSENFGDAILVLKVLQKEPQNTANFGGNSEQPMLAVDANGKMYETKAGIYSFNTPEGIPVRIILDKSEQIFKGVKKDIKVMPMVKCGIWLESRHRGQLTLKNVPIFWDQSPE